MKLKLKAFYDERLSKTGNIILPLRVLQRLQRKEMPAITSFSVQIHDKKIVCGVQEYSATKGFCLVPFPVEPATTCHLELMMHLPQAKKIVFGISQEFDKVDDKLNPIYHAFSGRTVLNQGDIVKVGHHEFDVLELEPSPAYVTNCDAEMSFMVRKQQQMDEEVNDNPQEEILLLDVKSIISFECKDSYAWIVNDKKSFGIEGSRKVVCDPGSYVVYTFGDEKAVVEIDSISGVFCKDCETYLPETAMRMHSMRCGRIYSKCHDCHEPIRKNQDHEHCVFCMSPHKSVVEHMRFVHPECICGTRDFLHHCTWQCQFCKLEHHPSEHSTCGSKTDQCPICNSFIKRSELDEHIKICFS